MPKRIKALTLTICVVFTTACTSSVLNDGDAGLDAATDAQADAWDGAQDGSQSTEDATDSGTTTDQDPDSGFDWKLDPNDPPETSQPDYPQISNPIQPNSFWGSHTGPKPTNTWWLGLVLDDGNAVIYPTPHYVRAKNAGIEFGLPYLNVTDNSIGSGVENWIFLGCSETPQERTVSEWNDLSVTMTWSAQTGSMKAPFVSGSPYATMFYEGLHPQIGFNSLDGTGARFEVTEGGNTYIIYTSEEITFADGIASKPLTGWVRIAISPNTDASKTLDAHANAVVVRGFVDLASKGTTPIVLFTFDTQGKGDALIMALPHHLDLIQNLQAMQQPLTYKLLKGTACAISGNTWTLHYPPSQVSFRPPTAIDPTMEEEIRTALKNDSDLNPNTDGISVYWTGKDMSKLARLALIADELGENAIKDAFIARLKSKLLGWLNRENSTGLLDYDSSWGGVVNHCVLSDANCDFGQGKYSDHHFHYGYHVYAAAVVAKLDPSWANTYGNNVRWLIRDYANPYRTDPYFPRFRHFDFYNSHSWTSGLINFGDGRNQESSSEAVHGYYGVQLWGEATADQDLANVGKIVRIAESVGAQNYWQIRSPSQIYDAPFSTNPCVGIVWNQKVDFALWFDPGPYKERICGIQVIPVTPATQDLINPIWVEEVWDDKISKMADPLALDDGWRDFLAAALVNWDKTKGCKMIREQTGHDGGNTKTNMLYYCATRP